MKAFRFVRARTCGEAAQLLADGEAGRVHAGGTDLLGLMKDRVQTPDTLVSLVDAEGLADIRIEEDGAIWIGPKTTLAQIAASEACRRFLPSLAEAAGQAASPQLRNRATIAGNLAQHTRCGYYRQPTFPCLKHGDDTCPVKQDGAVQDNAGVFDGPCVSAHPSSIAPVLGSLDAELTVRDAEGPRQVAFEAFWAGPRKGVGTDTILASGEVVEAIRIPARVERQHVGYNEIRQKAAFDWPLASCAVRYTLDEAGKIQEASVWFGSIAPTPWRAKKAEAALAGKAPTDEAATAAAGKALADAKPVAGAAYKVQLAKVACKRAFAHARGRQG